jgi:dienelactone hydrolase
VEIRLPEPLTPGHLERLVATFVPARRAPPERTVVELPVADARRALLAYRDALARLPCRPRPATPHAEGDRAAPVLTGTFPSLAIRGDGSEPLEPGDASRAEVPYLLHVPRNLGPDTPLVIGVHGHGGTAERFLRDHAGELAARGLAVLALDLPDHGSRGAKPLEYLAVLDPSRLYVNFRQSEVDVLAAMRFSSECGFALPDGTTYRPHDLRYLGYSLGSLIGVTIRSTFPSLGPTALIAAAGDLAGWLMVHLPPNLDAPLLSCLGGQDHGRPCAGDRRCEPPGICWVGPGAALAAGLFELPFGLALAPSEPLGPARVRTGGTSHAPVLLLTGGVDGVLYVLLQARLGDAYDLHPESPGHMRGPRSRRRHWPELGHDLVQNDEVRETAYDFLAQPRRGETGSRSLDTGQSRR